MTGLCTLTIAGRAISDPHDNGPDISFLLARSQGRARPRQTLEIHAHRQLADNAYESINKGDMLLVTGYLYTNDATHVPPVVHATHIGHDMRFGTSRFTNSRPDMATTPTA